MCHILNELKDSSVSAEVLDCKELDKNSDPQVGMSRLWIPRVSNRSLNTIFFYRTKLLIIVNSSVPAVVPLCYPVFFQVRHVWHETVSAGSVTI